MTPSPIAAFDLVADDGAHITAYKSLPAGSPKAIVQIAHGMAEHAPRYRRVINALTGAGYAVYANDHRGHGASAAAHGLGDFGSRGFQGVADDMASLTRLAKAQQSGVPLILLGHSMGSFASQVYLLDRHAGLSGLVLSGTAAVDAYVADPLCGFALTDAAMASMFQTAAMARHDPRLAGVRKDLPVLVVSGQRDPVTGPDQAFATALVDSYRALGMTQVEHRIYPDGRHEMFNETNRDEVVAGLIAWLDGVTADT